MPKRVKVGSAHQPSLIGDAGGLASQPAHERLYQSSGDRHTREHFGGLRPPEFREFMETMSILRKN